MEVSITLSNVRINRHIHYKYLDSTNPTLTVYFKFSVSINVELKQIIYFQCRLSAGSLKYYFEVASITERNTTFLLF